MRLGTDNFPRCSSEKVPCAIFTSFRVCAFSICCDVSVLRFYFYLFLRCTKFSDDGEIDLIYERRMREKLNNFRL